MGLPVGGAGAACRPPASPGRRRSPPPAVARPAGEAGARPPFVAGRHVKAVGGSDSGVRRGTSDVCAVHRRIGPAQDRRCRSRTANGGRRFPGRLHDITTAIAFCRMFFPWYNTEHRHGGIAMLTPDDVHHNRTQSVLEQRGRTLQAAWTRHPERFVRGIPQPDPLPQAVWINPPVTPTTGETAQ